MFERSLFPIQKTSVNFWLSFSSFLPTTIQLWEKMFLLCLCCCCSWCGSIVWMNGMLGCWHSLSCQWREWEGWRAAFPTFPKVRSRSLSSSSLSIAWPSAFTSFLFLPLLSFSFLPFLHSVSFFPYIFLIFSSFCNISFTWFFWWWDRREGKTFIVRKREREERVKWSTTLKETSERWNNLQ